MQQKHAGPITHNPERLADLTSSLLWLFSAMQVSFSYFSHTNFLSYSGLLAMYITPDVDILGSYKGKYHGPAAGLTGSSDTTCQTQWNPWQVTQGAQPMNHSLRDKSLRVGRDSNIQKRTQSRAGRSASLPAVGGSIPSSLCHVTEPRSLVSLLLLINTTSHTYLGWFSWLLSFMWSVFQTSEKLWLGNSSSNIHGSSPCSSLKITSGLVIQYPTETRFL